MPNLLTSRSADKRAIIHTKYACKRRKENNMLSIIAVILIVLWLLGMITSYTIGGFIHVLLVIAVISILIRIIRGNKIL